MSGIVHHRCLYAVGGEVSQGVLNLIQRLSLSELTWELLQLKLPYACSDIPCFKEESKVFLLMYNTLYELDSLQAVKTFPVDISSKCGTSICRRGILYCSSGEGAATALEIGRD
jgi:hypothetical protein